MARTKPRPPPVPNVLDPLPIGTQAIVRQGTDAVVYYVPCAPLNANERILKTTITLPRRSRWSSGLHFHTSHTEYLRLVRGSLFVELDGEVKILSAAAGGQVSDRTGEVVKSGLEIVVNRYARHNWGRAEGYWVDRKLHLHRTLVHPEDVGDEVIVEEWTDPSDITKPLFFWNLNGIITAPLGTPLPRMQALARLLLGSWWIAFQLLIIFWDFDNWPVFFGPGIAARYPPTASIGLQLVRLVEYVTTFIFSSPQRHLEQLWVSKLSHEIGRPTTFGKRTGGALKRPTRSDGSRYLLESIVYGLSKQDIRPNPSKEISRHVGLRAPTS